VIPGEPGATEGRPSTSGDPGSASQDSALLAAASGRGADFLLVGSYLVKGREVSVSFRFHDVAGGRLLDAQEAAGRIDLSLDETVTSAMAALMPRVADRVAQVARLKGEEAAREAQREAEAGGGAPAGSGEGGPSVASVPMRPGTLPPEEPQATPMGPEEPFRPLELMLGFAPFVPLGTPDNYLSLGYSPSLALFYRFPVSAGAFATGVHAGFMYLDPADPNGAAYFRWLVALGLDFRYIVPEGAPFRFYAQLSGGAAYRLPDSLDAQSPVSQRLTRVLPYGRGGVGVLMSLSRRFGVAVDALYHAYFYLYRDAAAGGSLKAEVISGLLPSLSFYLRL
jgi:hypothetical protein